MKIEVSDKEIKLFKLNQDSKDVITIKINDVLFFQGIIYDVTKSYEGFKESSTLIGGKHIPCRENVLCYIINC